MIALSLLTAPVAAAQSPPAGAAPAGPTVAAAERDEPARTVGLDAPLRVEPADRDRVLGPGWQRSADRVWLTSGDGDGFHVLVADAASGYEFRTAATLSEPGFDTDRWIGNACLAGDGDRVVVTYAPRTFTNKAELATRGGFTAVVDLATGGVTKLPLTSTLAYFSPSCGAGSTALITQESTDLGRTRVVSVDTAAATVGTTIEVPGQLTSAVPTADGIVAADDGVLVKLEDDGTRRALAPTRGVAFRLHADANGGVVFMDRDGDAAAVRHLGRAAVRTASRAPATLLATGGLDRVDVTTSGGGRVFVIGEAKPDRAMPAGVRILDVPKGSRMSVLGDAVVTSVETANVAHPTAGNDPTALTRPVRVELTVARTAQQAAFTVVPAAPSGAGREPHPRLGTPRAPGITDSSPTNPVEAERTCSVARNDPAGQAMQPKPRQVEWAVDQAITNSLYVQRPANWKNLGMPAYTPQGLFPPIPLTGNGRVPAQVLLGIIAQESNVWQAPGSVVPGVTGNPLIGNYYGLSIYDDHQEDDWIVRWSHADCGYGVAQVTDGMRLVGHAKPGETLLPYQHQRAVALDFAANVAAGLRILQEKWNETRNAGMTVNDANPARIENWFLAVWAYNSGFHPVSTANQYNGAWGVGWLNNPINPHYPANRRPFLEDTYSDATHPQDWPYPEKVMGWAGHPVEVLESPGTPVAGYRAAWWPGTATGSLINRADVKPPLHQFCNSTNQCEPGASYLPTDPAVVGEPAGPCAHRNAAGQFDLRCWFNRPTVWKANCADTCGRELLRFDPGWEYQADGTAYPPNCSVTTGLPAGAWVIDDQPDSYVTPRPGCARPHTNQGTFALNFPVGPDGGRPAKIDFHQLGGGFNGHFWYAHTRAPGVRDNSMEVTGTWTLSRSVFGWARVFVHMPDHGAHTQQAAYEIETADGVKRRYLLQRTYANRWVSLGAMPFDGVPIVRLKSTTHDGDGERPPPPYDEGWQPESEDIAFDAVAIQPLAGKPRHMVVSLGDSFSSGEGASADGGGDYYRESDNNGADPRYRNACHRSKLAWSRVGTFADSTSSIGYRSDVHDHSLDHQFLACSGAQTENLLPFESVPPEQRPTNAFGERGAKGYGEVSQLDKGFLDQHTTLVTLSIGGNDARFAPVMQECLVFLDCHTRLGDGGTLDERQRTLIDDKVRPSIAIVLREIHAKAPNAKIMLMGYPALFDPVPSCAPLVGLQPSEMVWMNDLGDFLTDQMTMAIADARLQIPGLQVWFSDPRSRFVGRGVCGDPESIHAFVTSKTPGDEPLPVPHSAQSFHPKITGNQLYAEAMTATLRQMGL